MINLNKLCLSVTLEHGTHHLLFAVCDLASPNSGISTLLNFQKLKLNSDMLLCNTFPAQMSGQGGMVGGVNCKSGFIYGKYIILQNEYLEPHLSLSEVVVYGI